MKVLLRNPINKANFAEVNREFEIAPELLRALDSARRDLVRDDIGANSLGSTDSFL
jgi:hypothetical protein